MSERYVVECAGAQHTLEHREAELVALDHDLESEGVLAAMGGATPFCVRAADAWRAFSPNPDDPRQLIAVADESLLSDGGREQIRRQIEFTEARMDRVAAKARAGRGEMWARYRAKSLTAERFAVMVRLPKALRRAWLERALLEAERTWTPGAEGSDATQVELLLMLACEQALASLGRRSEKKLWWKPIAPGARPCVLGEAPWAPGVTMVGVPLSWLRTCWLADEVIRDGRLYLGDGVCLDVDAAGAPIVRPEP